MIGAIKSVTRKSPALVTLLNNVIARFKVRVVRKGTDHDIHLMNRRVFYGEYKCSGPGANMTGRVPWTKMLTDEEAQPFLGTYFVGGDTWLVSP